MSILFNAKTLLLHSMKQHNIQTYVHALETHASLQGGLTLIGQSTLFVTIGNLEVTLCGLVMKMTLKIESMALFGLLKVQCDFLKLLYN